MMQTKLHIPHFVLFPYLHYQFLLILYETHKHVHRIAVLEG